MDSLNHPLDFAYTLDELIELYVWENKCVVINDGHIAEIKERED